MKKLFFNYVIFISLFLEAQSSKLFGDLNKHPCSPHSDF